MITVIAFAAALAVSGAPDAAVQIAQASPALASNSATTATTSNKAKLICENEEVTGSRLQRRRTCLTADQWREQRREQRLDVEHSQTLGERCNGHGDGSC